ncbi:MAG: MFS transporter [Sedimentisphaerales bacterium]|nr:MFS transporter [Sedimentisphaerales bacterium]
MNSSISQTAANGDRLKIREYIGYALGDTASNFFFQMFNIFLTFYYVDVWGIPKVSLLWLIPVVRLFDALNDPVMGLIADRTNTRWGKFRPYILYGAIPYGIAGYLLFAGPEFATTGKIIYAFITYMLMMMCYTVINVPYSSLMGVLSPSSRTRAVASSYRFVGAFAGGFLISTFVRPLVKFLGGIDEAGNINYVNGFKWTMAIFAVISVIFFWITFIATKERVKPPKGQKTNVWEELGELVRNWPWIMLLIAAVLSTTFIALRSGTTLFFFKYVIKDPGTTIFNIGSLDFDRADIFLSTGMLAQIAGTIALGFLARRIDKKYAASILCAITGISFMAFYFLPKDKYILLVVINAIGYLCMGPTSALTWALYGDVADYGEWKFGRRSTGLVFSASLFSIKTGQMVGGFLLPLFLLCFGFVEPKEVDGVKVFAEQSPKAILGIALAFSIAPGLIALLKAAALFIYPLNQKRVSEIEEALNSRRAAASAEKE